MRYVVYKDDCGILRCAAWDVPLLTHDKFCIERGIPLTSVSSSGCILFSRATNAWKIYKEASWKTPPHDLTRENAFVLKEVQKRFGTDEAYKETLSKQWEDYLERERRRCQKQQAFMAMKNRKTECAGER